MIEPVVGMPVTWIDPSSDPINKRFIETCQIKEYGEEGLSIRSIKDQGKGLHGKNRWLVTLERDGQAIMHQWNQKLGPMPKSFEPSIAQFSWHYLRPLS